jgi:hypothetical protein
LKADIHVFAAEGGAAKAENDTHRIGVPDRVASNIPNQHPVEVLAIEDKLQPHDKGRPRYWVKWLDECTPTNLPDYGIISADASEIVDDYGLQSKPWRRRFQDWGYEAHYWFLRVHEHGGVVRQDRCMLTL